MCALASLNSNLDTSRKLMSSTWHAVLNVRWVMCFVFACNGTCMAADITAMTDVAKLAANVTVITILSCTHQQPPCCMSSGHAQLVGAALQWHASVSPPGPAPGAAYPSPRAPSSGSAAACSVPKHLSHAQQRPDGSRCPGNNRTMNV